MSEYQPTPTLGWIDFSDNDRQKVLKVIELLKREGMSYKLDFECHVNIKIQYKENGNINFIY